MKLVAQLKLKPTPEQTANLTRTLQASNAAANYISEIAWRTQTFLAFALQKICYGDVRKQFGLSAQMTVRALAKVADAYKIDRKTKRTFRPLAAIAYDDRILSFQRSADAVSLWTLDGRQTLPFICGERQRTMLARRQGESDLLFHRGAWYLLVTCEIEEATPSEIDDVLGVDFGVTNIATDSDGIIHSGKAVKGVRHRHRRLRAKLQRLGTKASRRRLRGLAGQERRFGKDVNHVISKQLVQAAEHTKRAIALEDLKGIRTRIRVSRQQRAGLASWSFNQLRSFISYKAKRAGVPMVLVDPRNTSRTCPVCGCIDKANRPRQSVFLCTSCGRAGHADVIAAGNIRVLGRAAVMLPHVSEAAGLSRQGQAPRL